MTHEARRQEYSREHIYVVELELDYCDLTFSVAPCTATGTGDAKCYNTFESCQDLENYDQVTKIYRFCESRSPHPIGIDAIPDLDSVSMAPAQIDLKGGLGVRASVSLKFNDHTHSDIGIDPYVAGRTFIASDRGTFWTKLRARNPNYQFRALRVYSGYLVDGVYDLANFQERHYVIERMDVTKGGATVVAKDPLRLTSQKKAQAPAPSTGQLSAALTAVATSATLTPSGVGNSEYPASGKATINSEVMSFTRVADVLTLTRAQNNTVAVAHSINATVQLALVYDGKQVDFIVDDLLTNFATIDPAFIPTTAWASEVDTYLSGLLTGIVVKPTDVWKLLKELSEQMPHYLWWDERTQLINMTALKAPPISANVLDMDSELVKDSVSVSDKPEMRVSTVFVNFGQFDPTKKLDEPNNYEQTYVRVDTQSIASYTTNEIKTIYSRWISSVNKAAALQLAALIGRRFSDPPRMIKFALDAKDSDVWAGQNKMINHRDMTDFTGLPVDTMFQILSVKEGKNFDYNALEFKYGPELDEDEGGGDPDVDLVILGSDLDNINLRTIYGSLFPAPDASTQAKFIVESGVVIGSTSVGVEGMNSGSWPAGALVTLVNKGHVVGKGGDGGNNFFPGSGGGDALHLAYDLTLDNQGVIGSGGGGGGGGKVTVLSQTFSGNGGGGAGRVAGTPNGGLESGGPPTGNGPFLAGPGGSLGQAGGNGSDTNGGAAGLAAIDKNGFTMTETELGDVRGAVLA